MKITVFGATGQIGLHFIRRALDEGHLVKAYVRNPSKITFQHPGLTLESGELDEYDRIRNAIAGADVVISTLGPLMVKGIEGTPVLTGYRNIIDAMDEENVMRIIALGTVAMESQEDKKTLMLSVLPKFLANLMLPNGIGEMTSIGEVIKESDRDWSVMRILMPVDKDHYKRVRVSFGGKRIGWMQSRKNISDFFYTEMLKNEYVRSMPILGS